MVPRDQFDKEIYEELQQFFFNAITSNDVNTVKNIIKHQKDNININLWNHKGISPIHQCCIEGNLEILSILVKAGADVNVVDPEGWTSLHAAVASDNIEICQYLIKTGAKVLSRTMKNELPIDLTENVTITYIIAKKMIQLGYDMLARKYLDRINQSVVELAESENTGDKKLYQNKSMLRSILKTSLRPDHVLCRMSSTSSSSYSSSTSSCEDSELDDTKRIMKYKNSVQFSVNTLFKHFLKENDYKQLDTLLKTSQCNIINKLDRRGLSPLHFATINGYVESMEVLFLNGADVNQQDANGWTALHAAVVTSDISCIVSLLEMNSNIFELTNKGQSVFELTNTKMVLDILNKYLESSFNRNLKRTTSI